MPKEMTCRDCGKAYDGSADWIENLKHGIVTYYLCPRCQTPQDMAAAQLRLAVDGPAVEVKLGDPKHPEAFAQHVEAMMGDVAGEALMAGASFFKSSLIDLVPDLDMEKLADETMRRLDETMPGLQGRENLRETILTLFPQQVDFIADKIRKGWRPKAKG